jgi:hypothetical protein
MRMRNYCKHLVAAILMLFKSTKREVKRSIYTYAKLQEEEESKLGNPTSQQEKKDLRGTVVACIHVHLQ